MYGAIALLANAPTWPADPNRVRYGDLEQMVWYLAWTPHAIEHLQNPFVTNWLNYPQGVNLAQNTSSPLLGLLAAPLTLTEGPIASLNLLLWLAFPLSALSMFVVIRRWTRWNVAAFVGGALYGFSPYVVTQGFEHLDLAFVPLPPLIFLAATEVVRPRSSSSVRWGLVLGALLVAQFFIAAEVAATSVFVLGVAGVVWAIAKKGSVLPAVRRGAAGLAVAAAIGMAALAYPTWMMLAGPRRYAGPAYPGGLSADLVGTVAPTGMQQFVPARLSALDARLLHGNITDNGSYLGIPLLVVVVVLLVLCRRDWRVRCLAVMAAVTTCLSLGPHLIVADHATGFPLPWDLLQHLPFARNVITARFSLFTALFVSILVGLGMDDLRRDGYGLRRRKTDPSSGAARRVVWVWVLLALAVASAASLVPDWPYPTAPAGVPAFFSSPAADKVPFGSVVLISPYPSVELVAPQMWQAAAGMRFRIIGGYALVRSQTGQVSLTGPTGPRGRSTNFPAILQPDEVERFLWAKATGGPPYPAGDVPVESGALACAFRTFLLRHEVDAVISTSAVAAPAQLQALFAQALGPPDYVGGGATVWLRLQQRLSSQTRCQGSG